MESTKEHIKLSSREPQIKRHKNEVGPRLIFVINYRTVLILLALKCFPINVEKPLSGSITATLRS